MIVGLTGGIGSGKTTVGKLFKKLGVPVYNSDKEAKRLMNTSKKIKKSIIGLLGEEAYDEKGLNRSYIAGKVFNDPGLLKGLNEIVHPAVRRHFLKWNKKQQAPFVIQETALLFENKAQELYDKIILVTAPEHIKISRVMKRDGSEQKDILARIKNQLPDEDKVPFADFVIINEDLKETKLKVTYVYAALLQ